MKVGDLVRIKDYCKYGNKFAIIVSAPDHLKCGKIHVFDVNKTISALWANLERIQRLEKK